MYFLKILSHNKRLSYSLRCKIEVESVVLSLLHKCGLIGDMGPDGVTPGRLFSAGGRRCVKYMDVKSTFEVPAVDTRNSSSPKTLPAGSAGEAVCTTFYTI